MGDFLFDSDLYSFLIQALQFANSLTSAFIFTILAVIRFIWLCKLLNLSSRLLLESTKKSERGNKVKPIIFVPVREHVSPFWLTR